MNRPVHSDPGKEEQELLAALRDRARGLADRVLGAEMERRLEEVQALIDGGDGAAARTKLREAQVRLDSAVSSAASEPLARRLLLVEGAWLAALIAIAYAATRWPQAPAWAAVLTVHTRAAWFGALGGVTVAIFGLYSHVQARDFDRAYELWYHCKPVMGAITGWFVFFVYYLGILAVQGPGDQVLSRPELPYAIAFLAGFSERFTIRIIDKVMQIVTSWDKEADGTAPREPGARKGGGAGS